MRIVGDKDERGKALSANVERGADDLYCKMARVPSLPTQFFIREEI